MAGEALGNKWAVQWIRRITDGAVPAVYVQMDELFHTV